jgi:hypothetical protein
VKVGIAATIKHRGKFKTLSAQERKLLKCRQAIEPIIGHLKLFQFMLKT